MIIDTPLAALLITILIALIGSAVGYGVLVNKVADHGKSIERLQKTYDTIDQKLDEICEKVASILATLAERERK